MKHIWCVGLAALLVACGSSRYKQKDTATDWELVKKDSLSSKKVNDSNSKVIGKYVYLDDNNVVHIYSHCDKLTDNDVFNEHQICANRSYAKRMIDTVDFKIPNIEYLRVCASCVDDDTYEALLEIADKHNK